MKREKERESESSMAEEARRRRAVMLEMYGAMERVDFEFPTGAYTLLPSGRRVLPVSPPFSAYVDALELSPDNAYSRHGGETASTSLSCFGFSDFYPAASSSHHHDGFAPASPSRPELVHPAAGERRPSAPTRDDADLDVAGSPSRPCRNAVPAAGARHGGLEGGRRHQSLDLSHGGQDLECGGGGRHSVDSLYDGAALHIAAAASLMEKAQRRRRAPASEDGGDHLCISSSSSDAAASDAANANPAGDYPDEDFVDGLNTLLDNIFGAPADDDDEEDFELINRDHAVQLLICLVSYLPPVGFNQVLPSRYYSAAGMCTVMAYGVFFTVTLSIISALFFGRSRCLVATFLRALFLVAALAAEVIAAIDILSYPLEHQAHQIAKVGSWISMTHLVVVYALTWFLQCRRSRRRHR